MHKVRAYVSQLLWILKLLMHRVDIFRGEQPYADIFNLFLYFVHNRDLSMQVKVTRTRVTYKGNPS